MANNKNTKQKNTKELNTPETTAPTAPTAGVNKNNISNKGTIEMNSGNNIKKQIATPFNFLPSLFHTFAKLLPIGLYVSTLLESILFNDIRGFIIFLGLIINDLINIGYNYLLEKKPNEKCAIVRNIYTDDFFELSTPHTQYIAFVTGFLLSSMFFKKVFYYSTFTIFSILIGLTVWSRISVGCKDILDAGYNLIFGLFRGIIYYIIIKDYYEPDDVTPEDHWIEKILKKYLPKGDEDDEL
tara:strand:- start:2521 stop:3243 length:723 start_codon:yes stop_codon:yes gene_type:complete